MIGKSNLRPGIAMVELIFAIVVIGIVLLSTPMLIQQSISSSYVALQQESIAATASHTGILLSKHWDEADANTSAGVAPIITINRPPFNLDGLTNVNGRVSEISNQPVLASTPGLDNGEDKTNFDDIDDANGQTFSLMLFNNEYSNSQSSLTNVGIGDYVDKNISITTSVRYVQDKPLPLAATSMTNSNLTTDNNLFGTTLLVGEESNIKLITVNLSSNSDVAELNKSITLHAFSCNIGTYTPEGSQY